MLRGEPSPNHAIAQIIAHKSDADLLAGALSLSLSLCVRSLEACVGSSRMGQPQRRRRRTGVASDDKVGRKRKTAHNLAVRINDLRQLSSAIAVSRLQTSTKIILVCYFNQKWCVTVNGFVWVNFVIQPKWRSFIGRFSQILARKLNMKIQVLKNILLYFWLTYFNPCIEIWKFFLNFFRILAIENLERHLIFDLLFIYFNFWLYVASQKNKG